MNVRHDMVQCHVIRPVAGAAEAQGGRFEFLQLHRIAGDFMGDTWQLVSGSIEPNESAAQAALRELREETGLAPVEFYQLDRVNTFYLAATDTLWHVPGFCALVAPDAAIRLNGEHDAYRWTPRALADTHLMWPGERDAFMELAREILDNGPAKPYLRINPT